MQHNNKHIFVMIIVGILIAVVGFVAGVHYKKAQRPNFGNQQFMMGGDKQAHFGQKMGNFQRGSNLMGRPINGEIISQDDNSITVKLQDGSSKIVILSDKTTINKTSEGSKDDLKSGEKVTAFGKENSDGSITAETISIGGMFKIMHGEPQK